MSDLVSDLIVEQYKQIINAMSAARERMHKMALAGLASLPALVFFNFTGLGDTWKEASQSFVLGLPIMVFAFGISYRSERSAISRYGAYIAIYVDPVMRCDGYRAHFRGWESFTKFPNQKDIVDFKRYIKNKKNISTPYDLLRAISFECVLTFYAIVSAVASSRVFCDKFLEPKFLYYIIILEIAIFLLLWFGLIRILDRLFDYKENSRSEDESITS